MPEPDITTRLDPDDTSPLGVMRFDAPDYDNINNQISSRRYRIAFIHDPEGKVRLLDAKIPWVAKPNLVNTK